MTTRAEHNALVQLLPRVGFGETLTLMKFAWYQMMKGQMRVSFAKNTASVLQASIHAVPNTTSAVIQVGVKVLQDRSSRSDG